MALENLGTDINGRIDFTLDAPVACWDIPLTPDAVMTVTSPAGFNRVFFSYAVGTNVWVTMNGTTPVVPSTSIASTQELLPSGRKINVNGGQTLKFISDTASYVNVRFDQGS